MRRGDGFDRRGESLRRVVPTGVDHPGDVVQISNTGYNASYSDGEGDWQLSFAAFSNTAGLGPVWTGPVGLSSLAGQDS